MMSSRVTPFVFHFTKIKDRDSHCGLLELQGAQKGKLSKPYCGESNDL